MNARRGVDLCLLYDERGDFQTAQLAPLVDSWRRGAPALSVQLLAVRLDSAARFAAPPLPAHAARLDLSHSWHIAPSARWRRAPRPAALALVSALQRGDHGAARRSLRALLDGAQEAGAAHHPALLASERSWRVIKRLYRDGDPQRPFAAFVDTVLAVLAPLFELEHRLPALPRAAIYHSLSSGYAGVLAQLLARRHGAALVASDYGATRLPPPRSPRPEVAARFGAADAVPSWLALQAAMAAELNATADALVAHSHAQQARWQNAPGRATAVEVVPQCIEVDRFIPLYAEHAEGPPPVIACVGRVLPERDVKGFVRAVAAVRPALPGIQAWVVGALDEDPAYAADCQALVRNLGLVHHVRFMGFQAIETIYPRLGALIASHLGDTPPRALLEAMAAGVPVIATDGEVTRELVLGGDAEDRALGSCGRLVPLGDPGALAAAVRALLESPAEWQRARLAAVERSRHRYRQARAQATLAALYRRQRRAAAP